MASDIARQRPTTITMAEIAEMAVTVADANDKRVNALNPKGIFLLAYHKLGSLPRACDACGIKHYIGYMWLKSSGVIPTLADIQKTEGKTEAAIRGMQAEREFQALVPSAIPANNVIRRCNPTFDFTVHGVTVDVKYSGLRSDGRWGFAFAKRKRMKPDFYVLFFATARTGDLADGYRLFLVPHEMFAGRSTITMRPDHDRHPLNNYEIAAGELNGALSEAIR